MRFSKRALLIGGLLLLLVVLAVPAFGQEVTPETIPDSPLPLSGKLYERMVFPVEIDPTAYTNPFDSADIELLGIFQSPSGKQLVISGFWMQPYQDQCVQPCSTENLQAAGEPAWQVRFTPTETGTWRYSLQVRDGEQLRTAEEGQFEVGPSEQSGFVRIGANRRYFQYESGKPYIPIGHNLKWSWAEGGGLAAYRDWLRQLSESGGNYARLYIDEPWFIGLEWDGLAGDYRTAQLAAARLDAVLDMAAEYKVQLQLVVLWHQALSIYNGPPVVLPTTFDRPDVSADWDHNSYNIRLGGPLGSPGLFFTNQQSIDLFRRRLRYMVARWGYSPQIFAWEMVDEIDKVSGYDANAAGIWLQSAAAYLKQIDQYHHLVTVGSETYDPLIVNNPLLDFTTTQFYQRRPIETLTDQTTGSVEAIRQNLRTNPIPTLLTAYSLNPWFEPTSDDPTGVHFQDTLWASLLSGAAGGAASDWWDTYVIPQRLQRYYEPFAAFVSGINWPNLDLQPAEAALVSADYTAYQPVRLANFNRLFSAAPVDVVSHTITPDGVYPPLDNVPSYLYGQVFNNQLSQAQIYRVTLPADSYMEIGVSRVSTQADARLVAQVDNQSSLDLVLSTGTRNVAVRVPLAAGEHEIILDNLGQDWLELSYIEIGQLQAPARVLTLRDSNAGIALAWLQHRNYTWEAVKAGTERQSVLFTYQLDRMPAGLYNVEIWNPLTGAVVGQVLGRVEADSLLSVELVPLDSQLALRIFRQPDVPTAGAPTETSEPTFTPVASPTEEIPVTTAPSATIAPSATDVPRAATVTRTPVPPTSTTIALTTEKTPFVAETNTPRPTPPQT